MPVQDLDGSTIAPAIMHFRAQLDRSLTVLSERGLLRHHTEPLLFRLLWKLGVHVHPPHFLGFASIVAVYGTWFAAVWGTFMWQLVWSGMGKRIAGAVLTAAAAGACFGLVMAWLYVRERRELGLPAWESIGLD